MKINSNTTAIISNNYLHRSENAMSKSMEKLSSGYKINNASDNPAGYAISSKMRAQIKSLEKASDNADDGINFVGTAEGALQEVHNMCQRMNELAVKAANGTNTTEDREAIQQEINQLCDEIERIAETTEFNDVPILDGNFERRGYTDYVDVKVMSYSDETKCGEYSITIGGTEDAPTVTISPQIATNLKAEFDKDQNTLKITGDGGTEIMLEAKNNFADLANISSIDLKGIGDMRVQIGANEGQVISMNIPEISLKKMNLEGIDVTTQDAAREAISRIGDAISYTSAVRSKLGAYQNRMEHAINSLDVTVESMEKSYSTLVDTDMAAEMTEYTKLSVLQQAGTSMLAQANEFPQQALQLLQ